MIEQALYTILSGHAGLTALVGSRIYPLILPQSPLLPAVIYQRVDAAREGTHDGPSGLAHPLFQLSCWALDFDQARAVVAQVRLALDGYTGTVGGVEIEAIQSGHEDDQYEQDTKIYHSSIDFDIWHQEG